MEKNFNEWLTNGDINTYEYNDMYYLHTLARYLDNFFKNIPVPVISSFYKNSICLSVGKETRYFELDNTINYFDFLTIIKRWLTQFYPQYKINVTQEVSLDDDDIVELKKKSLENDYAFSVQDILLKTKEIQTIEYGIIEKITLRDDEFLFKVNNESSIRTSVTKDHALPVSLFLKTVREIPLVRKYEKLKDLSIELNENSDLDDLLLKNLKENEFENFYNLINLEVKNYIYSNSRVVKKLPKKRKPIRINYCGQMMVNFFKINYIDMKYYPLCKSNENEYEYDWGWFKIKFESELLKNDCLQLYYNKIQEDGIVFDNI